MLKEEGVQFPIHYTNKVLYNLETIYLLIVLIKKLLYELIIFNQRLNYFEGHYITILSDNN